MACWRRRQGSVAVVEAVCALGEFGESLVGEFMLGEEGGDVFGVFADEGVDGGEVGLLALVGGIQLLATFALALVEGGTEGIDFGVGGVGELGVGFLCMVFFDTEEEEVGGEESEGSEEGGAEEFGVGGGHGLFFGGSVF